MAELLDVELAAVDPRRLDAVLDEAQRAVLVRAIEQGRSRFAGRVIWNVNSTAKGGGVAEMLGSLIPYARGAGVDARWVVISGDDDFFRITKGLHNHLHGSDGDGDSLSDADRRHYDEVTRQNAAALKARLSPGDLVMLHDPQTAGMIPHLRGHCAGIIWRCHIGIDTPNDIARGAWAMLIPSVSAADACVFSRQQYVWEGLEQNRVQIIAPSIDPFSAKNYAMDADSVRSVLGCAGLTADAEDCPATYVRHDGSPGRVERRASVIEVEPLGSETPLVLQVSRWDRLKDPIGVMQAFASGVVGGCPAHLMLAGPDVEGVTDDPEGAETLQATRRTWEGLPDEVRRRIHIASLSMVDEEENAATVNALQRRATVVVQKSLAEGFGLTVAEAMCKSRPVVASRLGGIQDQIEDGVSGILLDDPRDPDAFATAICGLINDPQRCATMGEAARARIASDFLGARHLADYVALLSSLIAAG